MLSCLKTKIERTQRQIDLTWSNESNILVTTNLPQLYRLRQAIFETQTDVPFLSFSGRNQKYWGAPPLPPLWGEPCSQ